MFYPTMRVISKKKSVTQLQIAFWIFDMINSCMFDNQRMSDEDNAVEHDGKLNYVTDTFVKSPPPVRS